MGFEPVGTHVDAHLDGYGKGQGVEHGLFNNGAHLLLFGFVAVEHQFVMHLKNHPRTESKQFELVEDTNHGNLNHVGGCALDGHVDSVALGKVASRSIAGIDVGQIAAAPEEGLGVAMLTGKGNVGVDVVFDVGVLGKVFFNQLRGLFAGNAELLAETKGADAVDDAEIDGLGVAAQVF